MSNRTLAAMTLLISVLLFSTMVTAAQDDSPQPFDITTRITDAVSVIDYLEGKAIDVQPEDVFVNWDNSEVRTVQGAAVSPDASRFAWHGEIREEVTTQSTNVLCVHTFETTSTRCYLPPEDLLSFSPLRWSPDGRYITFTEDRIREEHEPDVYVYDTQANVMMNLTDDGITGMNYDPAQARQDFAPTWNPFSGDLLFMRNTTPGGVSPNVELYRVTPDQLNTTVEAIQGQIDTLMQERRAQIQAASATREAQQQQQPTAVGAPTPTPTPSDGAETQSLAEVAESRAAETVTRDIVNQVDVAMPTPELLNTIGGWPGGTTFSDTYRATLEGPTAVDNGGVFMAVTANNTNNPGEAGVWLIDLNTYQPMPLLGMDELNAFIPDWVQQTTIQNVTWTRDSSGLVISLQSMGDSAMFNTLLYFNLSAAALRPLINYSDLPDEAAYFAGETSFIQPDSGVLLPDNTFFYFNRSSREILGAVPVPPPEGGSSPVQVNLGRNLDQQARLPSSVGFNDTTIRVLLDHNLITLAR